MSYNADSIKIRDFRDAARATPGMYIGADGQDAAFNCFLEVLNNSCDEAMMNRGKNITITLEGDKLTCSDEGAGCPHGKNKDCDEVLIELFTKAHTSGKFDNENYRKVRGCHGVGTSAVCVCSKKFEVYTRREGAEYYMSFTNGIPDFSTAKRLRDTNETGSTFSFIPDREVFHIPDELPCFDAERIKDELELTSYFIPNVSFFFNYNGMQYHFHRDNGIKDFAKDKISNPLHKSFIYGYKQFDDDVEIEVFAQWTADKEKTFIFSNGALNPEGGTPIAGAKAAFTRTVNSISKKEFDSDLIRRGLVYIINIKHPHPIYQNQVKNKIQNPELRGYTQTVFTEAIKEFATKHRDEFDKIIEILSKEKRAEAAAEKARQQVLNATKEIEKNQKKKMIASDKLKDAEFLGEDSTLLIVEGDSAASSIAKARDYKKYGILAIRGKILNCLAHPDEKIFENEEIKLLLSAMNIVPNKYDSSKLRYGKIGICVDADSDGGHIALLIMAALRYLAPKFLEEGRLCWLRSPLYIVKNGKNTSYYFTDEEFNKVRGKIKGEVSRAKGLGALSQKQAEESMFGEFQRMDRLDVDDESIYFLESLMGVDVIPRKEFVFNEIDFSEIRE